MNCSAPSDKVDPGIIVFTVTPVPLVSCAKPLDTAKIAALVMLYEIKSAGTKVAHSLEINKIRPQLFFNIFGRILLDKLTPLIKLERGGVGVAGADLVVHGLHGKVPLRWRRPHHGAGAAHTDARTHERSSAHTHARRHGQARSGTVRHLGMSGGRVVWNYVMEAKGVAGGVWDGPHGARGGPATHDHPYAVRGAGP